MGRRCSAANSLVVRRVSPGRIILVLFWTKYAVPRQIKPGILKLTTSRDQRNLCTVFIFVSCEEKGCYRLLLYRFVRTPKFWLPIVLQAQSPYARKGAIYNFQFSKSLGTSATSPCIKRKETKIWILVDIFMKYTFLSFLILWRNRSRDQNGPKFNIRSKSLLEPFSNNIFKRSCSLITRNLKNGHDYFFLKKCGSRKSNWKVFSFLVNDHLR